MVNLSAFALWIISIPRDDEGPLPTPGTLWHWNNWTWESSIFLPLILLFVWYFMGMMRRPGIYRLRWRHAAFLSGWTALFLALVSPLHRLGDVLFSAHMLQHEVLLLIAAPLIAASHPSVTMLYAFPLSGRRSVGGWVSRIERVQIITVLFSALSAFLFHALALWIWHIPSLYQATLESDFVHASQHLSFFLSGLFFWSALYGAGRSSMSYGAGVLYVFGTAAHCSALGALLTFSSVLWYPIYVDRTLLWHLTPLQDQQLGGLLMWVPSGVVFIVIGVWMFARWLAVSDQQLRHTSLNGEIVERKEYI
jgi:putative membrane protein